MASCDDLKRITLSRLKTVKILLGASDWDGAAYMMGYGLECGLKAVICKTLNIPTYPDSTGQEKVDNFFKTHNFTQLLIASGMQGILGASGPVKVFENWSAFTFEYPPNWTEMRYDAQRLWSEKKVRNLYKNLVSSRSSIMKEVRKKW